MLHFYYNLFEWFALGVTVIWCILFPHKNGDQFFSTDLMRKLAKNKYKININIYNKFFPLQQVVIIINLEELENCRFERFILNFYYFIRVSSCLQFKFSSSKYHQILHSFTLSFFISRKKSRSGNEVPMKFRIYCSFGARFKKSKSSILVMLSWIK